MTLYSVSLHGRGVVLVIDGNPELCGFYKTEYVWADDEQMARDKAISTVTEKIKAAAVGGDTSSLTLEIDGMTRERRFWKGMSSPGFAFYREGEPGSVH
jgi:hypothetical protein